MAPGESYKSAMDRPSKSGEEVERFDDILTRLRSLVERLEGGNLSLEDSLQSFEQGMELCRRGASILDAAEKKVEVLLAGPPGANRTAPLPAANGGDGPREDRPGERPQGERQGE
jgi:exodeoxyribonuclease VII small subunit